MSLKSLKARLAKIPKPDLPATGTAGSYEMLKHWPFEAREELRHILRKLQELEAQEEELEDRERRRQEASRAEQEKSANDARIAEVLQHWRDTLATKQAAVQRRAASLLHDKGAPPGALPPEGKSLSSPTPLPKASGTKEAVISTPAAREPALPSTGADTISTETVPRAPARPPATEARKKAREKS